MSYRRFSDKTMPAKAGTQGMPSVLSGMEPDQERPSTA
jgi:hypothetical protein